MLMTRARTAGLAACVLVAVLAGCKSQYEVNVRNQADQPVTAEIRAGSISGTSKVLKVQRIGPGDRAWLGPAKAGWLKTVFLRVDFAGNVEAPATMKLRKGTTAVNVSRADEGAQGSLQLEAVRP